MRGPLVQIGGLTALSVSAGHFLALTFNAAPPAPSLFLFTVLAWLYAIGVAALLGYVLWLSLIVREPQPIPRVRGAVARVASPRFLGRRIAPIVLAFLFLGSFATFKTMIPLVNPFAWDTVLADLDHWAFGTDPWRLTHSLIGPMGTRLLDLIYGFWGPAWMAALLFFSLLAREDMHRRFLLSFFWTWAILGVGIATIFSSAGPCFLDLIGHPYAGRFEVPTSDAPAQAFAQTYLADAYRDQTVRLASGISAMPSLHVAIAALLVPAAQHYGRTAFAAALVYWALIFVGSVHLGWHYASDGVIGTAGALLAWRLTRPSLRA